MAQQAIKIEAYTYGDYLNWPDNERWELIDGEPYDMSPAPLYRHQQISMELARQIANFLTDRPCEVAAAPFDVRLPGKNKADEEVIDVVQPDIVVICDKTKIDRRGCRGAPDLIVEILSKSTEKNDRTNKKETYGKYDVIEYWIVNLNAENIEVYHNEDKQLKLVQTAKKTDTIVSKAIEGFKLDVNRIFI